LRQGHYKLYADRLKARKPIATHTVKATLVHMSPIPEPKTIAPYRRCLVEYVYEVEGKKTPVVSGKIITLHWCILEGRKIKIARRIGQTYTLKLQPASLHPQLKRERTVSDVDVDELHLPLFLEMD